MPGRNDPQRIGPYAVLRKIGGGGMGVVYLGVAGDEVPAAVKVIRPEYAEDPGFRRRFAQEARSSARVSGPGVAEVLAHRPDADPPWLATEFIAGPSLADAVRERMSMDVARLGALLAAALRRIHDKSVVHRDLKPSNVMLGAAGPVIIDFGIARAYEDTRLTGTAAIGTSGYIAPEYLGHGRFDTRSDVFALGAVLAFAALGHSPYGNGHPAAVDVRVLTQEPDLAGLEPALGDLLRACLSREPADRPTLARLEGALSGLPGGDRRWPPRGLAGEIARRVREVDDLVARYEPTAADAGRSRLHETRTRTAGRRPVAPPVPQPSGPSGPTTQPVPPRRGRATSPDPDLSTFDPPVRPLRLRPPLPRRGLLLGLAALSATGLTAYAAVDVFQGDPPDPRQNWRFAPSEQMGASVLADGALYLGAYSDDHLYAVDAATGEERWSYAADGPMTGKPAVLGGTVFAASDDNRLHAVDIRTGRRRWVVLMPVMGGAAVAAADGRVLARDADGVLHGIDPASGRRRWSYTPGGSWPTNLTPVAGGTVFALVFPTGVLHAVNTTTGKRRWSFEGAGEVDSLLSPSVHDGTVCLGTAEGWVYALDARSGKQRWKRRPGDKAVNDVRVDATGVYVHCQDQYFYALDPGTGRTRWRRRIGAATQGVAVAGGTVYAGRSHPTKLLALNSLTGKSRWEIELKEPVDLPGSWPWSEREARISSEIHLSGDNVWFTALGLYSFRVAG
ncbi:serine/threonine-protein kinase [Streptomyces sp. NPDC057137]|uniref:serine/threonine-protein kinase n=1 Tax=Streptomyces sp. NPDC057137 TaxID=3346030 RepID=UPI00363674C2